MSLHSNPHSVNIGTWLTIATMALAALAAIHLVPASAPILWLLAGCVGVWALLAQASHIDDSGPIRARSSRHGARSPRR
jgi:hypothetical protein